MSIAILVGCIIGLSYFSISYSLDKLFRSTLSFYPPILYIPWILNTRLSNVSIKMKFQQISLSNFDIVLESLYFYLIALFSFTVIYSPHLLSPLTLVYSHLHHHRPTSLSTSSTIATTTTFVITFASKTLHSFSFVATPE